MRLYDFCTHYIVAFLLARYKIILTTETIMRLWISYATLLLALALSRRERAYWCRYFN